MMLGEIISLVVSVIFITYVVYKILPPRGVEQIHTNELKKRMQIDDVQIIDVRSPVKYRQFHIYGSKNIPLRELGRRSHELDKDKAVIFVCQTGIQGNNACKKMKRKGYKNLANLQGGLSTWDHIHIDRT